MPNYTGTVESFSIYDPYPDAPINTAQYSIRSPLMAEEARFLFLAMMLGNGTPRETK